LDRNIVITLAGPLAALVLCVTISLAGLLSDLPGGYKASVWLFLAASLFEFFRNLYPQSRPIRLHNGGITYNDGRQIIILLDFKRMPQAAQDALPFFATGEYEAAGEQLHGVIDSGAGNSTVYRLAISAFILAEKSEAAELLSDALMGAGKGNSDDHSNAGLIKARLHKYEEALLHFAASLRLNPDNAYSLVNRGFVFLLLNRYEEAIGDFDRSVSLGHEAAYALSNRGLAKIKMGNTQAGLEDIHASLEMNGNNSYAYKNLGIYHLDRREYAEALVHFEKAYALDCKTHQLETYLAQTRQVMEEAGQNTSSSA
jgi:tetratricopeptide (TPR) repeat protein